GADGLAGRRGEIDQVAAVKVSEDIAYVGGGSLPDQAMKTVVLELVARGVSDADLAYRLRTGEPAVVGRLQDGKLLLDIRTVLPDQETALLEAVRWALAHRATAKT